MNPHQARLALSLLAAVAASLLTNSSVTAQQERPCKAKLEWTLVEYTAGDVGSDAWRWRAHGQISGQSNGMQTIPPFPDDPASLAPGAGFVPGVVLAEYEGEKGDFLAIKITFEAKEIDPGTPHPNDTSDKGKITAAFQCVGTGSVELTDTVSITDAGGEDVGAPPPTPGTTATVTFKFKLTWDP